MSASEAPINRNVVEASTPALRLALGIAFVSYSAYTTIQYAAQDLDVYFHAGRLVSLGYIADRYWYALLFAVIIFLGEVVTSGKSIRWYLVFLIPDTIYTGRQIQFGLNNAFNALLGNEPMALAGSLVLSWIVALVIGAFIAKWGEVLIFGSTPRQSRSRK
jgi:hypothetical protein